MSLEDQPRPLKDVIKELREAEEAQEERKKIRNALGQRGEFEDIIADLKDVLEEATILKKSGFTQDEISSHLAFQVIEDDLRKVRKTKKKERAERIFKNLLEGLEANKQIDPERIKSIWKDRLGSLDLKKRKDKKGTRKLSSYQQCIKVFFAVEKRKGVKPAFLEAVAFCKDNHKSLDEFMAKNDITDLSEL